ncbi:hypothetical protein [Deinococcus planocerae]|uniref:hypothetical protein n=1 Tax=Deinococcus planocerae TaxID=1737569 RepID=UPI0011AFB206|nr:hypothetical protein [Deinococcus planocerae]
MLKQATLAGVLALGLGLVACGPSQTKVDPPPSGTYPYNPAPSLEESTDTRVPYLGDWAFVVRLPDGSERLGVVSIKDRGAPTDRAKNGGVGLGYLCRDDTCAVQYDASYGVINTYTGNGAAQLGAVYVDQNSTTKPPTNRLAIIDSDSKVSLNAQNNPVIAGPGTWVEVTGQPGQTVRAAFVQMDSTPGDDIFGVPRTAAFAQAREAAAAVTVQQVSPQSLLRLPTVVPTQR